MSTTTSTGGTTGAPAATGTPRALPALSALRTAVPVVPRRASLGDRTGGGLRPRGGAVDRHGIGCGRVDLVGVSGSLRGVVPAPLFVRSCGTPVPGSARHPAS